MSDTHWQQIRQFWLRRIRNKQQRIDDFEQRMIGAPERTKRVLQRQIDKCQEDIDHYKRMLTRIP